MAAFNGKDGGVLDAIRCDEPDYLIWKWHPKGSSGGGSERANAIRLGSSLRIRDGSVAAFVYATPEGANQDFIEGPYDGIVSTGNLPVLATLVGKLYDAATPFPAEVYFINLADLIQIKFGVPYFDVFDPRFTDYGIPTAVRGSINFKISDYREFIKLHRLDSFDMATFQAQVKDTVVRMVKEVVANAPANDGIPAVQIERHIGEINALVEAKVGPALYQSYGVTVQRVDISDIEVDKASDGYRKLQSITQNKASVFAQAAANVVDTMQTHRVGARRIIETNKEEGKQVAAGKGLGEIGKNVTEAIGGIIGGLGKQKGATPPPIPVTQYYVVLDGEQAGPFDMGALADLASDGKIEATTLAWKDGMGSWEEAGTIPELGRLFGDRGDAASRAVE